MLRAHHRLACLGLLALLAGLPAARAEAPAAQLAQAAREAPPLIPLAEFFAPAGLRWSYRIAPDGRTIGWIASLRGKPTIHIRRDDDPTVRIIAAEQPISAFEWAADSRHVLFARDRDGNENFHLFAADMLEPERAALDLTPFPGTTMRSPQMLRDESPRILADDPRHVLIMLNKRDPALFDLYRVDIVDGELVMVAENPGDAMRWVTNSAGTVVARIRSRTGGGWFMEVPAPAGAWRQLIEGAADEQFTPKEPSRDGRFLWALSSRGRDKMALVRLDLDTGEETVIHARDDADLTGAWIDAADDRPIEAWSCPGRCEAHYFDAALARDLASVQVDEPAEISVLRADRARARLILRVTTARAGDSFHLLDRAAKTTTLLAEAPIARRKQSLSPMAPVAFAARDGLALNGYLTLPLGGEGRNLPLVLLVHGGPWARDYWGYDPMVQMVANRGYAVLAVNFRGSTGFGRAFIRASYRQFAGKMHDDLVDGVRWAVSQGIADPARIAIAGASYGGYAALVGLTVTPELFAAGIDIFGPADLVTLLESFPPYWKQRLDFWRAYVGDPADPRDRAEMAARSPLNHVERIRRPLLLVHGDNDARVGREQSDRIAAAMRKTGIEVDYLVFPDEGHGVTKPRNRIAMAQRIEAFLARHLGGRAGAPSQP